MGIAAALMAEPVLVVLRVLARSAALDPAVVVLVPHLAEWRAAFANGRGLLEEPNSLIEAEILESQRARRADVGVVAGIIRLERAAVDRGDFGVVTALNSHHLVDAGNLFAEADASRAVNTAIH